MKAVLKEISILIVGMIIIVLLCVSLSSFNVPGLVSLVVIIPFAFIYSFSADSIFNVCKTMFSKLFKHLKG